MNTKKQSNAIKLLTKLDGPLTFGRLIWATRTGEEISQTEFAKLLGISKSHLNDIEKERKTVSPERAAKFAKILGYSEERYVKLALQAILDNAGLKFKVEVRAS